LYTSLNLLLIGLRYPERTISSSFRANTVVITNTISHHRGTSWRFASVSRRVAGACHPLKGARPRTSERVLRMAKSPPTSPLNCPPWVTHGVDYADPVETTLANALRRSAHEFVASSSATQYSYAWNKLIFRCSSLQHPRCPIPAIDLTVACTYTPSLAQVYLAAIIKASEAIAFFQKINVINHLPTLSSRANFVREAAKRRIETTPTRRKRPFLRKESFEPTQQVSCRIMCCMIAWCSALKT
jgi:hypothetical protein